MQERCPHYGGGGGGGRGGFGSLEDAFPPARGGDWDSYRSPSDGKHRSHRFLAANQFMPLALELEGAEEHAKLTEQWLRGEIEIPEIAHKWQAGPAVPLELVVPDSVRQAMPRTIP